MLSLRLLRKWAESVSFSVYTNNLARDPLRHDVRLTSLNLRKQAIALIDRVGCGEIARISLESKRHAAAHRSRRLHQVHRMPVVPQDRNVSLRQQIALDDSLNMIRK